MEIHERGVRGRSPLRSIAEERASRDAFLLAPDETCAEEFRSAMSLCVPPSDQPWLLAIDAFARDIGYRHGAQSPAVYYAHPLRVATLYMRCEPTAEARGAALALVHNVFEVTDLTGEQVSAVCGDEVAAGIHALRIDRSRQWDADYQQFYYGRLRDAARYVQAIKVFDKLDNLFLLSRNPDRAVRELYLDDVVNHIIPLAEMAAPNVLDYLSALILWNRNMSQQFSS